MLCEFDALKSTLKWLKQVLILVLMEDALRAVVEPDFRKSGKS